MTTIEAPDNGASGDRPTNPQRLASGDGVVVDTLCAVIVSDSAQLLFVHVQKTGGLTVQQMLLDALPDAGPVRGLGGGRHAGLGAALKARPEIAGYFVFGFVRNPWARMYSWYAMVQRRRAAAESGNEFVAESMERNNFWSKVANDFDDFDSFVLRGPDEIRRLRTPQLSYLRARGRRADFIGRTESLDSDIRAVFDRLDLPPPRETPRNNAGPPEDYRHHYSEAARAKVAKLFADDIEAFGYTF